MQKAILESVFLDKGQHTGLHYFQPIEITSWFVAQQFNNKKQSNHFLDRKHIFVKNAGDVISLRNKIKNFPNNENLKKELRGLEIILKIMFNYSYRKTKILTSCLMKKARNSKK